MHDFYLIPENGLGDQLLDVIGITVLANLFSCKAHCIWGQNKKSFPFGTGIYDRKVFDFDALSNLHIYDSHEEFIKNNSTITIVNTIQTLNPSATLSPSSVYSWLHLDKKEIEINDLIQMYNQVASLIGHRLDLSIEMDGVIAIHVRCTDKIQHSQSSIHLDVQQYEQVWSEILTMAARKQQSSFFICSESDAMRRKMTDDIRRVNPDAKFVIATYPDAGTEDASKTKSVATDLFMMSKCDEIHQCTNYSTFSILASLIGSRCKLVNYRLDKPTLLHAWMPCCTSMTSMDMELSNPHVPLVFTHVRFRKQIIL
jgi:hypothetical protein